MTTRARLLFRGTTVSVVAPNLRREGRRAGRDDYRHRKQFGERFATHLYDPAALRFTPRLTTGAPLAGSICVLASTVINGCHRCWGGKTSSHLVSPFVCGRAQDDVSNVGVRTSAIQFIVCVFPIDAIDRSGRPSENGRTGLARPGARRGAVSSRAFEMVPIFVRSAGSDSVRLMGSFFIKL
jgi:hypothetical protein